MCGGNRLWVHPKGKCKLKELWAQVKRWHVYVPFSHWTKIPKSVFWISRSSYRMDLDTLFTVALPWHCQPVGTIKMGGLWCSWGAVCDWPPRSESGGSYLLMSLWWFVCIWPCHVWHACDIWWCQLLAPFVDGGDFHLFLLCLLLLQSSRRCCEVADCGMIDGAMRNYVVQLGVPICRTALPWWTQRSSVLAVEFHIPWFQGLLWLHMDSIQTALLWWTQRSAILAVEFHIPWFQALLWLASRGFYVKGDRDMGDCCVFAFVVFMDIKMVDLVMGGSGMGGTGLKWQGIYRWYSPKCQKGWQSEF